MRDIKSILNRGGKITAGDIYEIKKYIDKELKLQNKLLAAMIIVSSIAIITSLAPLIY